MPRALRVESSRKHLTKAEVARKRNNELAFSVASSDLVPPVWLGPEAVREFNRVAGEAKKAGWLDNLDLAVLAVYADAVAQVEKITAEINSLGAYQVDTKTNGAGAVTTISVSPLLRAHKHYTDLVLKTSARLGITAVDRLKLRAPDPEKKKPENKFLQFLNSHAG